MNEKQTAILTTGALSAAEGVRPKHMEIDDELSYLHRAVERNRDLLRELTGDLVESAIKEPAPTPVPTYCEVLNRTAETLRMIRNDLEDQTQLLRDLLL